MKKLILVTSPPACGKTFISKKLAKALTNCVYLDKDTLIVLSKQILRSGTSIGANIAESECAISKKDFLSKLYIALKETSETLYWLELLYKTEYLDKQMYKSMYNDCEEIKRILQASTKTISAEM